MSFYSSEPTRYFKTGVLLDPARAEFPYRRYWRGDYRSDIPIVMDRRAGFYPRDESTVEPVKEPICDYPQHCFQTSPATRYPCYPECTFDSLQYRRYLLNATKHFLYR